MGLHRETDNLRVIGISEMAISDRTDETLITYSLGSCLGVSIYDPVLRIGGMVHCQLPVSTADPAKARDNPSMYVDTGIMKLIDDMIGLGARKERLVCKLAGAGSPANDQGMFRIGERNYAVARKILWKNGILIQAEHTGGTLARTLILDLRSGRTRVRLNGVEELEL